MVQGGGMGNTRKWIALLLLLVTSTAHAMATIEFLKLGASDQYQAIKPIMLGLLSAGYKNVPSNEFILAGEIKKLAFEKGYTYQSLDEVAKEAAIRLGMTR
jgi:hypothetical protein